MTTSGTPDPLAPSPATAATSGAATTPEDYSTSGVPGYDTPGYETATTGGSGTYTTGGYAGTTSALPPESTSGSQSRSTTDAAKAEAGNVKDTAVDAGKNVAATAKDQAANVAGEAKQQARGLLDTVTSEVREQGRSQQQRIGGALHSVAQELGSMASKSEQSGPVTDLVQQASRRTGEIAHWLEDKEPRDVLEEVRSFARRRPVAFLALCGLAGVVAGRLTRGAVAANTSLDSPGSSGSYSPTRAIESGDRTSPYGESNYATSTYATTPTSTYGTYESERAPASLVEDPGVGDPTPYGYAQDPATAGTADDLRPGTVVGDDRTDLNR